MLERRLPSNLESGSLSWLYCLATIIAVLGVFIFPVITGLVQLGGD
jgi:hypothetical protein